MEVPQKLKTELLYVPANPTSGYISKKKQVLEEMYALPFFAALFTIDFRNSVSVNK